MIKNDWTPTLNARHGEYSNQNLFIHLVFNTLMHLIENPNLESPLEEEIAMLMREKPGEFEKKCAEFTKKFAKKSTF